MACCLAGTQDLLPKMNKGSLAECCQLSKREKREVLCSHGDHFTDEGLRHFSMLWWWGLFLFFSLFIFLFLYGIILEKTVYSWARFPPSPSKRTNYVKSHGENNIFLYLNLPILFHLKYCERRSRHCSMCKYL